MFAALVYSRSRMGIISALCTFLFLLLLVVRAGRRFGAVSLVLLIALIGSIGLAAWLGIGPVAARYALLGREGTGRWALWQDVVGQIAAHPWKGTGLGTFPVAYTRFQTVHLTAFVDHAHNDYLEFTSELGLVGVALLFVPIVAVLAGTVRAFFQRTDGFERALALGVSGSILSPLLHSGSDFNLHIPANALVFSLLLALGFSTWGWSAPQERRLSCAPGRRGNRGEARRTRVFSAAASGLDSFTGSDFAGAGCTHILTEASGPL